MSGRLGSGLALWALASMACAPAPRPPWSVEGGFIRDAEGRAVVLRGANVSNAHKRPPWFDFHGPEDFRRMRDEWGMNSVRFLVSWAAIEPERGQFDGGYLDELAAKVGVVAQAGQWVILDMHQDLYGVGFAGGNGAPRWTCDEAQYAAHKPTQPWFLNYASAPVIFCYDQFWKSRELQSHYVEAWRQLAARLRGVPGVIGFDPMNEPYWGSVGLEVFEEKRLAPLYRQVIAAVRSEMPDALAFVEPAASRNLGLPSKLPALGEPGLVYAPHSYDGEAEQGLGFDPARREVIVANVAAMAEEARSMGAALLLGEYGGNASHPGIAEYMDAQYAAAGAVAAGSLYWHYSKDDGYGLLASDGSEKPNLLGAVVRPMPVRVSGDPVSWSFDPLARTFRLTYRPDRRLGATTVVSTPPRVWPEGYQVDCGGCASSRLPGQLRIDEAPQADEVTLTVSP